MIYFDNAATTINKPDPVATAMTNALTNIGNSGRGVNSASLSASRVIYEVRTKLSRLFNVPKPEQIAFTQNATEALNTAIYGTITSKDHVITTAAEHNSVLRPLYNLLNKGTGLTIIPCDESGRLNPHDIEAAILPETKAIIMCHGSNLTGNVFDIKAIGEIARSHDILFIVDASQTAGIIPIDVQAANIDILCFTGHKGLLGPQGTGGIYVKEGVSISPLKQGGTGIMTYSKTQPEIMPTLLEAGTLNGPGIAGLGAALDFIEEAGISNLYQTELQLTKYCYEALNKLEGIKVYGDFSMFKSGSEVSAYRCPIISFNLADISASSLGDILANEFDIQTRTGGHCAPLMHESLGTKEKGSVRLSFSHYNTFEEIDCFISAMKSIIA